MNRSYRNLILISIVVISALMHLDHFPKDLMSIHVWRQAQTQSTIVNFYEEDMNILNPRRNDRGNTEGIFRMEFPLMQWIGALLYKVFGRDLILIRIYMFVVGILTVIGMYKLLQALFNNTVLALMGAWAFNFSPSFYYYTINPMPDNLALCFSVWGLAMFFLWYSKQKNSHLLFSSIFLSAATLSKLPFILFYAVPLAYFIRLSLRKGINRKILTQVFLVFIFAILPIIWYLSVIPHWDGNPILKGIFGSKESFAKILDYFQHNLISTLPELLLNYGAVLFFLGGFYFLYRNKAYKDPRFGLFLFPGFLLILYYILEANAIGKIHDYYLFPFLPFLFILVAYGAYHLFSQSNKSLRYLTFLLLLILPFTAYLRMQNRWNPESPGFNRDLLIHKNKLREAVPKDALVVAGNDLSHFIFFYYIDKKGWGFDNDRLTPEQLKEMIQNGAEYLYTDTKMINPKRFPCCLEELILEKGSIRIYRLKK